MKVRFKSNDVEEDVSCVGLAVVVGQHPLVLVLVL